MTIVWFQWFLYNFTQGRRTWKNIGYVMLKRGRGKILCWRKAGEKLICVFYYFGSGGRKLFFVVEEEKN